MVKSNVEIQKQFVISLEELLQYVYKRWYSYGWYSFPYRTVT